MPDGELLEASPDGAHSSVSKDKFRDTGIALIGNVSWPKHLCQFYQDRDDLLDVIVPYMKAGLENNEKCVWVTSDPITVDIAREAMTASVPGFTDFENSDQIEIFPHTDWYLKGGVFDFHRVLNDWQEKLDDALAAGHEGMRVTGNTAWLEKDDWAAFNEYEHAINDAIKDGKILVLCTYSLDECSSTEILDVISSHEFALVKREGGWELVESADHRELRQTMERREREAAEAIRTSETRYHSLFNNMIDGFAFHRIIQDDNGKPIDYVFLEVNRAFEEFTGLKGADIVGKSVREVIPGIEDDPADWIGTYGKVALDGTEARFEQYSEPLEKWYSVSAYSPEKGYFAAIFEDVTERKKAHAAIMQANEDWQHLFDSVPDLLSIIDKEHRILRANKAMAERMGITQEECVGLYCYEGVHGLDQPPDFCPHSLSCEDGEEHMTEVHEPRLGGHFLVSTTPFYDSDGEFQGSLHIARDITARKKAENALRRAMRDAERSRRYSEALNEINTRMSASLEFDQIIDHAVNRAAEVMGAGSSLIAIRDEDGWLIKNSRNLKTTVGDRLGYDAIDGLREHLSRGNPISVMDVRRDARINNKQFKKLGMRSVIFAPLLQEGEFFGFLGVGYDDSDEYSQADIDFARKLANLLALSLESARLYELEQEARGQAQSFATRLSILHEIGLSLNRETDRDKLLRKILAAAADVTAAGVGALLLITEGKTNLVGIHYADWYRDRCAIEIDASSLHQRIGRFMTDQDRDVVIVPDFQDGYKGISLPEGHMPLRGLLIGSLRDTRGRDRGYLVLSDKAGGTNFTREDKEIISLLATQSSVALTSLENLDREHSVAEMLQSSLLPSPPDRDDMDVGLLYQSASSASRIGGDYYDFIDLGEGRIAVVVADVCGKGLDAAAYTAMVKYMLHAYVLESGDPGHCLTRLNDSLAENLSPEKFITLSLAIIDMERMAISYALAGHPAPFMMSGSKIAELQSPNTMPLGVLQDYKFQSQQHELRGDDTILLFTDGLIESRTRGGDPFGYNRLRAEFASMSDMPAQELVRSIMNRVAGSSEAGLADDVALVAVKLAGDTAA